jgi:hypothetical protein
MVGLVYSRLSPPTSRLVAGGLAMGWFVIVAQIAVERLIP